jgi:hypothetical protein
VVHWKHVVVFKVVRLRIGARIGISNFLCQAVNEIGLGQRMPLFVRMNKRGRAALVSPTTEPYHEHKMVLVPQVVFIVGADGNRNIKS